MALELMKRSWDLAIMTKLPQWSTASSPLLWASQMPSSNEMFFFVSSGFVSASWFRLPSEQRKRIWIWLKKMRQKRVHLPTETKELLRRKLQLQFQAWRRPDDSLRLGPEPVQRRPELLQATSSEPSSATLQTGFPVASTINLKLKRDFNNEGKA